MQSRLLLYDTSNFINLPIGGQLTSISNFLRFLREKHPDVLEKMILVGVSEQPEKIGNLQKVNIHGMEVDFLPVALVETDLSHTQKSLRIAYVKGLLKYGKKLRIKKTDCNYIHTPEAYAAIKILNLFSACAVFSHGSFFNMEKGFRFFQKNKAIKSLFNTYLKFLLKTVRILFVLDKDSEEAYLPYNKQVFRVNNSIVPVLDSYPENKTFQKRLVFVGRLSKEKRVETILQAVELLDDSYAMTVIGDGETWDSLQKYQNSRIRLLGALKPAEVKEQLINQDILIMNSTIEGIPMTILEALSFGIPVVTTDVGGIGTVVRFGVDSEKTDGTAESIRVAVETIATEYERYAKEAYKQSQKFHYLEVNAYLWEKISRLWPNLSK
ncbi:MAG: glycosyltransferase family 4 protein [Lachnospiraceae bacterium]|nr:glycosyltransferase family 4 protein [Lachnospiraceae bacterium]